jgi:serine/threonine protein kinase
MPAVDDFLKTVLRSGLLTREQLGEAHRQAPVGKRDDADTFAEFLVRAGWLSRFQARKLLQGKTLGLVLQHFQVLAPVGKGGMSTVYLARDSRSQLLVALKVLPPKRARQEERILARFLREMDMCQRVAHPNLAQTFEVGVYQGVYYIAMEFIPGRNLYRLVQEEGPLPVARAAHIFSQVASALDHAHCRSVIHRDLKPSNVLVTANDLAKVLDLGLAIYEGEIPTDYSIVGGQGYVVGTMDYIAPEQSEDAAKVDARSDIYGMGATLYFVLTGQPPFPGGSSLQKIKRHRSEEPTPISQLNPTVPQGFADLVSRMMAKRPEDRFESADLVRTHLLPWIGSDQKIELSGSPLLVQARESVEQTAAILDAEEADSDLLMTEVIPAETANASQSGRGGSSAVTLYHLAQPNVPEKSSAWPEYLLPIAIGGFIGLLIAALFVLLMR